MKEITGETKVTGIIGYPLTYTLSPSMHNRAFKVLDLNFKYLPFVVGEEDVKAAIEGIRALKIKGINVTMPHKEAVIEFLDELSSEAMIIGAVNTINNDSGRLIGYNTDGTGFLRSLREESFDPEDRDTVILGSGGAAKAVAVALAQAGAKSITIVARKVEKAEEIKDRLESNFSQILVETLSFEGNLADTLSVGELIVNATPIGMKESGDLLPVPLELINDRHFVYDLVYAPLETALLKAAKGRGAKVASGLGMLLYQAAAAFEIWTGISAPVDAMRETLIGRLNNGERPGNAEKEDR